MISESDEKLVFRTFSGKICTFRSQFELIAELIQKSTGMVSADELAHVVSEELNIPVTVVRDAIDDLVVCEILTDSHKQFLKYHTLTCNPPRYPSAHSISQIDELTRKREDYTVENPVAVFEDTDELVLPIYRTLQRRHSCRTFSEKAVEAEKLFAICKVACSCSLSPVASAGALFPLALYFINRVPAGRLPAGLYQYDPQNETLLLVHTDIYPEIICYALNDTDCIFGAPCIFFVSADLGRHMRKYANAGYRYTLLEAGHAIQNMTIAAEEMNLGSVEYGGFCDEAVKQFCRMPEMVFPLACYAVGYEEDRKREQDILQKEQRKRIIEKIVCGSKPNLALFMIENEAIKESNLRVVVTKFEDTLGRVKFGTGVDPAYGMAYMKSVMEAYERYALNCRYFDHVECADRLGERYLDPGIYAPYTDTQRKQNRFAKFRKDIPVEWLRGENPEGELCICAGRFVF